MFKIRTGPTKEQSGATISTDEDRGRDFVIHLKLNYV